MIRRAILALALLLGAGDLQAQITPADSASLARAVAGVIGEQVLKRDTITPIIPPESAFDSAVVRQVRALPIYQGATHRRRYVEEIGTAGMIVLRDTMDVYRRLPQQQGFARDPDTGLPPGDTVAVLLATTYRGREECSISYSTARYALVFARAGDGWSFARSIALSISDGGVAREGPTARAMKVRKDC